MRRAFAAALLALLLAPAAAAELRRVEAEGVALPEAGGSGAGGLREAALRAGIAAAVDQVALGLLDEAGRRPAGFGARELSSVLGDERRDYTERFRILRDEGLRAPDPLGGPGGYVVVAEVLVEVERLRARLVAAGLLAAAAPAPSGDQRLHVILEPLATYRALAWTRRALEERGRASSAVPVELAPGRAVLAVDTPLSPDALARALGAAGSEAVRVEVIAVDATSVTLHVDASPPGAPHEPPTPLE